MKNNLFRISHAVRILLNSLIPFTQEFCPLAIRLNSRNYVSKYTIGSVAPLTIISSFSSTSEYFCNSPGRFPAESGLVTTLLPLSASHSGCKHYLCGYVEYYDCKCPRFYLDCRYNQLKSYLQREWIRSFTTTHNSRCILFVQ